MSTWYEDAAAALGSGDKAQIRAARDRLLAWHAAHHGGRNAPLDAWRETRTAPIQGVYCTGCAVWPVIVQLHEAQQ
jgi:hypothetical protein